MSSNSAKKAKGPNIAFCRSDPHLPISNNSQILLYKCLSLCTPSGCFQFVLYKLAPKRQQLSMSLLSVS